MSVCSFTPCAPCTCMHAPSCAARAFVHGPGASDRWVRCMGRVRRWSAVPCSCVHAVCAGMGAPAVTSCAQEQGSLGTQRDSSAPCVCDVLWTVLCGVPFPTACARAKHLRYTRTLPSRCGQRRHALRSCMQLIFPCMVRLRVRVLHAHKSRAPLWLHAAKFKPPLRRHMKGQAQCTAAHLRFSLSRAPLCRSRST